MPIIDHIDPHCRAWIERCPFIVISSIDATSAMDVSPKGDPPGFVKVPHKPYTFRASAKIFGLMWLRCDVCRRYAPFRMGGLAEADYCTKSFSCSRCGAEAYPALVEPVKETGMGNYHVTNSD